MIEGRAGRAHGLSWVLARAFGAPAAGAGGLAGGRRRARGRGGADAGGAAVEGLGEDSRGTGKLAQYPTFARG